MNLLTAIDGTITFQVRIANSADFATLQQACQILEGKNLIVSAASTKTPKKPEPKAAGFSEESILDLIRTEYHARASFGTHEAYSLVKKTLKLGKSTVRNALRYGTEQGILKRLEKGNYVIMDSEKTSLQFKPTNQGIIEIHTADIAPLLQAFSLAEKVAPGSFIYITKDGIACRVNDERTATVADIRLAKSLFVCYRVDMPLSIAVDSKALLERVKKQSQFTLRVESLKAQDLRLGDYSLKTALMEELKRPVDPIKPENLKGEIRIEKAKLVELLESAKANASYLDISYDSDKVVLSNVSPSGDDWSHDIGDGWTVSAIGRTRYVVESVLQALKAIEYQSITLRDNGECLVMELPSTQGMTGQFIIGAVTIAPAMGS